MPINLREKWDQIEADDINLGLAALAEIGAKLPSNISVGEFGQDLRINAECAADIGGSWSHPIHT